MRYAIRDFHLDDIASKRDLKELERDIKEMYIVLMRDPVDVGILGILLLIGDCEF